jgi:drug/metabolite transporter (DMT)-like permease
MNRPLFLLIGTGAVLGLNFPIGKMAMTSGVTPALWAAVISAGAGLAMLIIVAVTERNDLSRTSTFYFAIVSAFLSYVVPNVLTYSVIPKIGSGLAAIMFALSPVVTALLSVIFRVRPPNLISIFGIILGLAGAGIIIFSRQSDFSAAAAPWILLALLIPIFLGAGNVFRTMAWPFGASPRKLAAHTNLAAVPFLAVLVYGQTGTIDVMPLTHIPELVALQLVVSTIMFLMFFRLQQVGGPTYLSQIGYVAAAVGVIVGVFYFGETYPQSVWAGAAVIAVGIAFSTLGQAKKA